MIDLAERVSDEESFATARRLIRKAGSAGAAIRAIRYRPLTAIQAHSLEVCDLMTQGLTGCGLSNDGLLAA